MMRGNAANSRPIAPIGAPCAPPSPEPPTLMSTLAGAMRSTDCLNHSTKLRLPPASFSSSSVGLSQAVWSYSVVNSLRIGESALSPSVFILSTAWSKVPKSAIDTPCMKRCHSRTYSALYRSVSCLRICSGLPCSERSSRLDVLSTQSELCSSLVAASLNALST